MSGVHLHSAYVPWWRGQGQLYIDTDTYVGRTWALESWVRFPLWSWMHVLSFCCVLAVLCRLGALGVGYRVCSRTASKRRTQNVVSRIRVPLRALSRNRARVVQVFRVCPFMWMRIVSCSNIFGSDPTPGVN